MTDLLPRRRLSGFYFFWFAGLGALLPYWSLYMRDRGFSAAAIGLIFGILLGTKVVAPNVWGWLVDRYGGRVVVIRLATAGAALMFLWVPFVDGFLALALLMAGYGFFSNASIPQFEALTFNHLGSRSAGYSRIRLWGSVGFIASVAALGPLVDTGGTGWVVWWMMATLVTLFVVSLSVPDAPGSRETTHGEALWTVLRRPQVTSLLAVCFLVQFSHGPYYSFFSIYLEDHGYGRSLIGGLWALGVMAEVLVFAFLPAVVTRTTLRQLMLTAVALAVLRWSLLAAAPDRMAIVVLVQVLHMASFGLYHAVAVSLVHRLFRGPLQGRGQALYSSLGFGAGGAAGALSSGFLWDVLPHHWVFVMAASAAALGWVIAWLGLRGVGMVSAPDYDASSDSRAAAAADR